RMQLDGTGVDEATPPLRRSVSWELVLAAAILAVTAVLSELPPASYVVAAAQQVARPQRVVVRGSDFATTVRVQLTASPGTVGTNTFATRVVDYDTGKPA